MFCSKCGASIEKDSKFCSSCGQPIDSEPIQQEQYVVTIKRKKQWYVNNPVIKVCVDNNTTYQLPNEGVVAIPLSEGKHAVNLSYGPRNKAVNLNVTRDLSFITGFNRLTGGIEMKEEG